MLYIYVLWETDYHNKKACNLILAHFVKVSQIMSDFWHFNRKEDSYFLCLFFQDWDCAYLPPSKSVVVWRINYKLRSNLNWWLVRLPASEIHYAFRGRLVSLLAPARGMSTLPAKGGFSRPSSFTHYGVSSRPQLPQDKEGFFENHRTQKKRFSFFKETTCISSASIAFTTLSYSSMRTKISIHPKRSRTARNASYRIEPRSYVAVISTTILIKILWKEPSFQE